MSTLTALTSVAPSSKCSRPCSSSRRSSSMEMESRSVGCGEGKRGGQAGSEHYCRQSESPWQRCGSCGCAGMGHSRAVAAGPLFKLPE